MKRLENKVAIITGGADGLGKAGAIKFIAEGAKVIIWDLNEKKAAETLAELSGKSIEFMKVNTADFSEVENATAKVISKYGQIDILVNNAGITRDATFKKMTIEQWQQVIDVNLTGVFYCTKAVSEHMLACNGLNISRFIHIRRLNSICIFFNINRYIKTPFSKIISN